MQTAQAALAIPDPLRDFLTLVGIGGCAWTLLTFMGTPAPQMISAGIVVGSAYLIRS